MNTTHAQCACSTNRDGTTTTFLCPVHATQDPCHTKAQITGRRRRGSVERGCCSHCGWTVKA